MSILTKVFVVLVAVLSVMLVALIVPFVANTENYKTQRDVALRSKAAAEAAAAAANDKVALLASQGTATEKEFSEKIQALNQTLAEQARGRRDAENQLAQTQAQNTKLAADVSRLSAAHDMLASVNKSIADELNQRRTSMVELQTQLIQQIDQSKSLASTVDTLNHQVRRFSEQIQLLGEEKRKLEDELALVPPDFRQSKAVNAAPVPQVRIEGKVTKVQSADGQTLVQISVGKTDGVAQNMKFIVYRGQQYLGTLSVRVVDDRSSAGLVELSAGSITAGDLVVAGGAS